MFIFVFHCINLYPNPSSFSSDQALKGHDRIKSEKKFELEDLKTETLYEPIYIIKFTKFHKLCKYLNSHVGKDFSMFSPRDTIC